MDLPPLRLFMHASVLAFMLLSPPIPVRLDGRGPTFGRGRACLRLTPHQQIAVAGRITATRRLHHTLLLPGGNAGTAAP